MGIRSSDNITKSEPGKATSSDTPGISQNNLERYTSMVGSHATDAPGESMPLRRLAIAPQSKRHDVLVGQPFATIAGITGVARLRHVVSQADNVGAMLALLQDLDLDLPL